MHPLRFTALRLISSSATTATTPISPARLRAFKYYQRASLPFPPRRSPQCALQRRWNSDYAGRRTDTGTDDENGNETTREDDPRFVMEQTQAEVEDGSTSTPAAGPETNAPEMRSEDGNVKINENAPPLTTEKAQSELEGKNRDIREGPAATSIAEEPETELEDERIQKEEELKMDTFDSEQTQRDLRRETESSVRTTDEYINVNTNNIEDDSRIQFIAKGTDSRPPPRPRATTTDPEPEPTEIDTTDFQATAGVVKENQAVTSAAPERPKFRYVEQPAEPKETVFVANLYFDVTADDLRAHMEKFGVVEYVTIVHDNRGISKGFGYVTFDSTETATFAIDQMDGTIFEGRPVQVQYARAGSADHRLRKPTRSPSRTIYISRIPFKMTAKELHDLFDDIENVIDVRISMDRRTGQLRGFAHAEFLNVDSAKAAYGVLGRKRPYGKPLHLDFSHTNRRMQKMGPGWQAGWQGVHDPPVYSGPKTAMSSDE